MKPAGKVSTYVGNHTSGCDIAVLAAVLGGDVSFAAHSAIKGWPLVGTIVRAIDGLSVPTKGTKEDRLKFMEFLANH